MKDKTDVLAAVCAALLGGDRDTAAMLARSHYPFQPAGNAGRKYTDFQMTCVFIRDGFVDRYSGQRLVFPGALRLLSRLLPAEFPFQSAWKMSETHLMYWQLFPTVDHVMPVARGGADAESNWVTTSMLRNGAKSNWTLAELGWTLLEPTAEQRWDGLTGWFLRFVSGDKSHLDDAYLRRWHAAAVRAMAGQQAIEPERAQRRLID